MAENTEVHRDLEEPGNCLLTVGDPKGEGNPPPPRELLVLGDTRTPALSHYVTHVSPSGT